MVVTGFPTRDAPHRGIFNLRTSRKLGALVDLTVLFLRAWRPGRQPGADLLERAVAMAAPQLPAEKVIGNRLAIVLNLVLYRRLGYGRAAALLADHDLIYAVGAAPAGIIASYWAARSRRHLVLNATGSDVNSVLPQIAGMAGVKGWERHVQGVVCQSHALQDAFLRMYRGVPNVKTFYRGVDLELFTPAGEAMGPLADRVPVRFLYLGGFPAYVSLPTGSNTKGGWTLLRAWQAAESRLAATGASLLIGGPASTSDPVRRWHTTLRHPDRVHLQGLLSPDSVPGFIRASDVMLVPSMNEGLPNASIEASACARAVFGSDTGGIREVIVNDETGLLLPPGDIDAWSAALADYAGRAVILRCMGVKARRRMEELFDSRTYAPNVVSVFEAAAALPLPSSS
jgi:glycosyltransferase involved in cell wall biosynthesis